MADAHTKGDSRNKFCSLRKDPCPCGNSYTSPCDSVAAGWEAEAAGSSKYVQRYGKGARRRSHEAHHIACVAAVTGIITVNEDIKDIVWNTKWCVNVDTNMIALPLWPHTIEWYFDLGTKSLMQGPAKGGRKKPTVNAPPYKDLAHHDYDHGEYINEVNETLKRVVTAAKAAVAKDHKDPTGNLAGKLNSSIGKHKKGLMGRGTHAAWEEGMNDPNGTWYEKFSMSADNPSPRAFPAPNNTLWEKMLETAEAFLKL
jgi:hypothetical protein